MKLVVYQSAGSIESLPGVLTDRGVVGIADAVPRGDTPQETVENIIDGFDSLRPSLARLAADGQALPMDSERLRAPLPRPGKIINCIANYW